MTKRTPHKIAKPSVLAFTRKISPATGMFFSNSAPTLNGASPITPERNTLRTVFNAATTKKDLTQEILKPQVIANDTALLPAGHDWLAVTTSLIVCAGQIKPQECNEAAFSAMLNEFIAAYSKHGYLELAKAYLSNMISGRWLFRNRTVAQGLQIKIDDIEFTPILGEDGMAAIAPTDMGKFNQLAEKFALALTDYTATKFSIVAFVEIGEGQEVYPSQIFDADKKSGQGKGLQTIITNGVKQVIFTPQKISNAMRCIDVWYKEGDNVKPLAIEAYGIDREGVVAHRKQNNNSIFDLFDVLPSITEELRAGNVTGDAHYVMASLIRGGLYQQKAAK